MWLAGEGTAKGTAFYRRGLMVLWGLRGERELRYGQIGTINYAEEKIATNTNTHLISSPAIQRKSLQEVDMVRCTLCDDEGLIPSCRTASVLDGGWRVVNDATIGQVAEGGGQW